MATHPVPGEDAIWIAECKHCDDMTQFVSRGGFRNDGIEHCYTCGNEKRTRGIRQDDIDRMITSAWCHWQKHPLVPYNWHELSEEAKWEVLNCTKEANMQIAVCQPWLESERGWGQRPDGFSLHQTQEHCTAYIKAYWDDQPKGPAPDEYSRPDGNAYLVKVSDELFKKLKKHKGCRYFGMYCPGPNMKVDERKL